MTNFYHIEFAHAILLKLNSTVHGLSYRASQITKGSLSVQEPEAAPLQQKELKLKYVNFHRALCNYGLDFQLVRTITEHTTLSLRKTLTFVFAFALRSR